VKGNFVDVGKRQLPPCSSQLVDKISFFFVSEKNVIACPS